MARPGLAAHELERIGVLLLRHHAAAGGRRIGQLEEPELLAGHQDEVLGDARQVHHRTATRRAGSSPRSRDRTRRPCCWRRRARSPSARGEGRGVDGVAGAGDRARAERQRVGFLARRVEPRVIAAQRRGVAQQEVRHQHRHGAAHVRVRRHQRVAGPLGLIGERRDDRAQLLLQQRNAAAQVQPQIDRHLLVARAAGVQAAAGVADARDELALDEAVHVLVVAVDPRRIAGGPARGSRSAPSAIAVASAASSTPARASASAHARLPVTSSSKRRRSNGNDTPKSNAAGSGAESKRPDQRCWDMSSEFRVQSSVSS